MFRNTLSTHKRSGLRQFSTGVVLVALLFNLAAGYFLPTSANAALTGIQSYTGNLIVGEQTTVLPTRAVVICTPNGLRVIQLGSNGEPVPDQPDQDPNCFYCLSFSTGQLSIPETLTATVTPALQVTRIAFASVSRVISLGVSHDTHAIRGPPA